MEKDLDKNFPSGVLEDTRTEEQKAKDFRFEELFSAPTAVVFPTWEEWKNDPKNQKMLSTLEVQNQDGSYSCLAQAVSLALAINNYKEEGVYKRMSPRMIYPYRTNKPGQGMFVGNAGDIAVNQGIAFEMLMPSEGMNEDQMNNLSDLLPSFSKIALIYKPKTYVWLPVNTIDALIAVLATGKPAVICLRFGTGEWTKKVPVILSNDAPYGHGITALPEAFFLYEGKKAILIQDSWGINTGLFNGRRIITEDWFTQGRVSAAIWFEDLNNLATLNSDLRKPKYHFVRNFILGSKGSDVAMLQRCLGYLQDKDGYLFPLDIEPTGYFGGITRNAVKRFQTMSGILATGDVDAPTKSKLNEIFNV